MRTLATGAALGLLLLGGAAALGAAPASESSGFRAGPEHTGVYGTAGPAGPWELRWLAPTGGTVRSAPAFFGGTLFFGSGDGALHAVEALSGRERWRFATGAPVPSSPAVAGGTVFFTSHDHGLYAVAAADGRLRWRFAMGEDLPFVWGWDYFLSSPAVEGGRVYAGSGDGHVYAVDAATGREIWRFATGGRVRSSPAVGGDRGVVGSMDGKLYALDAGSGRPAWAFATEGASLDSTQFGYDRTSVQSSPAVAGDLIVVGSRDGHLYAVDREKGTLRWRFDHETSWVASSPAIFEGMALVGSSDGHFFQAVDLQTGKERWRHPTLSNVYASPAVAAGVVYFGCQDGTFYALDARSGAERFRFRAGGRVFASPAVASGAVYFGSDDGSLYALGERKAAGPVRRAVFWNEKATYKWFQGDVQARDFFAAAGYEVLGTADLAGFLRDRAAHHVRSVVVFASDVFPDTVAPRGGDAPLLRQYLDAGGKVVWLGAPPLLWDFDPATGKRDPSTKARTTRLLGVEHANIRGAESGTRLTAAAARWGLRTRWLASLSVDPRDVTTVLALDEEGKAAAWVKSFGGPEGTGFVRLWGREEACSDLVSIEVVAEHGL
jgi:outer membrane protein assembly factor BamB